MPPDTQNQINQAIAQHTHDGNLSKQIDPKDLFAFERQVNPVHYLQAVAIDFGVDATVGDGHHFFHIPDDWDLFYLTEVHAEVITAGVTGTLDIQIDKNGGTDMLSTVLTVDTTETGSDTAAIPVVINLSNDQVSENDVIRIDIDAIHTVTASKGLLITLGFQEFRE